MITFLTLTELYVAYRWRLFFWLFLPMNVAQDSGMTNNGWDIIRFGDLKNSYFRGTYFENRTFANHRRN